MDKKQLMTAIDQCKIEAYDLNVEINQYKQAFHNTITPKINRLNEVENNRMKLQKELKDIETKEKEDRNVEKVEQAVESGQTASTKH